MTHMQSYTIFIKSTMIMRIYTMKNHAIMSNFAA